MIDPDIRCDRREWEVAFVRALKAEAQRRWDSGEASRPGHRTRFVGVTDVELVHEGPHVYVTMQLYLPVQDSFAAEYGDRPSRHRVNLTWDDWATAPVRGVAQYEPAVAALNQFSLMEDARVVGD